MSRKPFLSEPIRVGIVGSGHFATAVVTQAASITWLHVVGIAEQRPERGIQAFVEAGYAKDQIVCSSRMEDLRLAAARGQPLVTDDVERLLELSLDAIVEATGHADAGAGHALMAIERGLHVAMVTKEADAVVGPILAHRARAVGVVYSAVAGDQHGLLIELCRQMELLGLRILCGGKARDREIEVNNGSPVPLRPWGIALSPTLLHERVRELGDAAAPGGWDLSELVIAANATGLLPDRLAKSGCAIHCPPLYVPEIPQVLCPHWMGGVLGQARTIDGVTVLRSPGAGGMGGGVFVVVEAASAYSAQILATKGCLTSPDGRAALIYRPYHLCGVETPLTLAQAVGSGEGYYGDPYRQRIDLVARARRPLQAGEVLGGDHSPDFEPLLAPAGPMEPDRPLPLHLGTGRRLVRRVEAGALLTVGDIEEPSDSVLWSLRKQQEHLL